MRTAMTSVAAAGAVTALASLSLASCFLSGFERGEPIAAGGAGGEGGAGGGGGGGGEASCDGVTIPDPPAEPDQGGDIDVVMALRSIELGEDPEGATLGLDLDAKCTCAPDGPSCQSDVEHCDAPGGVDNSARQLFTFLATILTGVDSASMSEGAESGRWSIMVRVRGYNGQASDAKVRVDWYLAGGFVDDMGLPAEPAWDGTDAWPISSASFVGEPPFDPTFSQYSDENAYVVDGKLVAALPQSELRFAGATATMRVRITGGVILADVVPTTLPSGATYALENGLFAGRWRMADVFQSFSSYRDEMGVGICAVGPVYTAAKTQFCNARDIPSALGGTASQPCDAVSLAFGFAASPVQLGPVAGAAVEMPFCTPETDPATDGCG